MGETSFWNKVWVRNVFLKYVLGAKRLSEIWFGCETSFWNIVWVRNVFLNYEDGGETSFLFMGRGRNVFPKYELGAKRPTKKWSSISFNSHLVYIRWFIIVLVLYLDHQSSFDISPLLLMVCPYVYKLYGSTQKYFLLMHIRAAYSTLNIFSPLLYKYSKNDWFFK